MRTTTIYVFLVLVTAVFAAGCGTPDIKEVRSCLKGLDMTVEDPPAKDKEVSEGVFGSTDLTKGTPEDITIALAAVAKSDKAVKDFRKESTSFADELESGDGPKLDVESGTSGRYVWVVMGSKKQDTYGKAKDCVKS
ncbi:MAG: hypothetical protein JWM86_1420 [Thermoleophilia bacterium]|nr:hypothetical protein [Thermoleophilia bacterium]